MARNRKVKDDGSEAIHSMALDTEEGQKGKLLTINEAAQLSKVTRQAIYVAIKQKKLRAVKMTARWNIHMDDLEDYRMLRYSRSQSLYKGNLLFDNSQGYYSIAQTAQILNTPSQRLYHAARMGRLKAGRKGVAWVVHIDDIRRYFREHLQHLAREGPEGQCESRRL